MTRFKLPGHPPPSLHALVPSFFDNKLNRFGGAEEQHPSVYIGLLFLYKQFVKNKHFLGSENPNQTWQSLPSLASVVES